MRFIKIDCPTQEKITWVETTFREVKDRLLQDEEVKKMLDEFKQANQNTWRKMREIGVTKECRECALSEGSCCRKKIDAKYDGAILLINKLLGVNFPAKRFYGDGCYFLGPHGCKLIVREVICINYLCERILNKIDHKEIISLQQIAGREMEIIFSLQERIKKILLTI